MHKQKHKVFPSLAVVKSCNTYSVQESKRFFCFVNLDRQQNRFLFSQAINFARTCYQPKLLSLRSLLHLIVQSLIGLWVRTRQGTETNLHVLILSQTHSVQSSRSELVSSGNLYEKREFTKIPIEQHNHFRWLRAKALKQSLAWFLNQQQFASWGSCPLHQHWCQLWRGCEHSNGRSCRLSRYHYCIIITSFLHHFLCYY